MTKDLKQILAEWAQNVVIPRAQRNIGATQSVRETNASGTRTRQRRRVASGTLKESLTFFIKKGAGQTKLTFTAKGKAKQYADVIEQGRRPNRTPPPIEPIYQWMKQKNIRLQKQGGKGFDKQTDEKLRSVAYLISRKIGKYGITGIHYMKEAVDDSLPELRRDLQQYVSNKLDDGN
jgi:hypothetical protein